MAFNVCTLESDIRLCPELVVVLVYIGGIGIVVAIVPLELELEVLVRTCLKSERVDGVEGCPGGHVLAVGIVTEVHTEPAPCGNAYSDVPCIGFLTYILYTIILSVNVAGILGTGREESFV